MSDKPITKEIMEAYISTLEKQVQQATLVIRTLEELNENLEEINPYITEQISNVMEKLEKALTTVYIIKEYVVRVEAADKELNDKAYELTGEIKEKISALKGDIAELKSAIKVDRVTNIVGWSVFITSILTMLLKLWGKI